MHKSRSMGRLARQIASVALLATLAGCATRYIPVNHYIETERVKVERDSVHYTDTVRIAERGDTVLVEVIKWRTRYKTATDTLIKIDTVQLPPQLTAPRIEEKRGKRTFLLVYSLALSLAVGFVIWEFKR